MTRFAPPQPAASGITLSRLADLDGVADAWRALEARADGSFFQSWTWMGCLARERFAEPWLLRAEQDGQVIGLALLNRSGLRGFADRWWLGESGDPALDGIYVEHNGPLLARGCHHLLPACLRAMLHATPSLNPRLRLAGVDAAHLAAAHASGTVRLRSRSPAPFIDLAALGDGEDAYLASLSANTRQQLRRSDRRYVAAGAGPVVAQPAATLAEALTFLDALAVLHQATWTARGQPGAFARPWFRRFHGALLARALPRGEAELLRIAAGSQVIGYLYNFRHRGRVLAYQSGFDYAAAGPHGKPGLTCHHAAIARARQQGMTRYDFLAGGDRYKSSLANAATTLHWLDLAPPWSVAGIGYRLSPGALADPGYMPRPTSTAA